MRSRVISRASAARGERRDGAEVLVQPGHDDEAAAEEAEDDFGFAGKEHVSQVRVRGEGF